MRMLDHDPIDSYLSRCLKNWTRQVPLPLNGKQALYYRIKHVVPEISLHIRLLQLSFWFLRNIILIPLDILLTPMVYSKEDETHSMHYGSRLDFSSALRVITNDTLSHGIEIFTYIV